MSTPIITIKVLKTSEAECIASDIIAPDLPAIPAINLKSDSTIFTMILIQETFIAISLLLHVSLSLKFTSFITVTSRNI